MFISLIKCCRSIILEDYKQQHGTACKDSANNLSIYVFMHACMFEIPVFCSLKAKVISKPSQKHLTIFSENILHFSASLKVSLPGQYHVKYSRISNKDWLSNNDHPLSIFLNFQLKRCQKWKALMVEFLNTCNHIFRDDSKQCGAAAIQSVLSILLGKLLWCLK